MDTTSWIFLFELRVGENDNWTLRTQKGLRIKLKGIHSQWESNLDVEVWKGELIMYESQSREIYHGLHVIVHSCVGGSDMRISSLT